MTKRKEMAMKKWRFSTLATTAFVFGAAVIANAKSFPEFPVDSREGWHHLWKELMWDISIIGVVFALITLYFLIKYRRKSPDQTGDGPKLGKLAVFGWALIPALVFMADDLFLAAKNFELWKAYRNVPAGAYEVKVEAYMWGWDFTYNEGIKTTNELRVPVGKPIVVRITSRDVVHSFFLPYFKNKWDAVPGRQTYVYFQPKEVGEYLLTCAEYCGMLHSSMYGKVIVMPEADFNKWVDENKPKGGAV